MTSYNSLFNRNGYVCLLWVFIQQGVVGLSTYLLITSISNLNNDDNQTTFIYLALFAVSLVVVYVPYAFSNLYSQQWRFDSYKRFIDFFISISNGKLFMANKRYKSKYESWLTAESYKIFEEFTSCLYSYVSNGLNFLISLLVIGLMLDQNILIWYSLAVLIIFASKFVSKGILEKTTCEVQHARTKFSSVLLAGWDNITIGNHYNLQRWQKVFYQRLTDSKHRHKNFELTKSVISSIAVSLATLVISLGNGLFIYNNVDDAAVIATLIVTMPRQLQIVQSLFYFYQIHLDLKSVCIKYKNLLDVAYIKSEVDIETLIKFDKIQVLVDGHNIECANVSALFDRLLSTNNGRITLLGENGAGKSCILRLLKMRFSEEAYLLPAESDDLLFDVNTEDMSTGKKRRAILDEVSGLSDIKYLLLDEWDANLDLRVIYKLRQQVDLLSKDRVVVEVLHRKEAMTFKQVATI